MKGWQLECGCLIQQWWNNIVGGLYSYSIHSLHHVSRITLVSLSVTPYFISCTQKKHIPCIFYGIKGKNCYSLLDWVVHCYSTWLSPNIAICTACLLAQHVYEYQWQHIILLETNIFTTRNLLHSLGYEWVKDNIIFPE